MAGCPAPPALADAFCATRLDGDWGHAYGTPPGHRRPGRHPAPGPARRVTPGRGGDMAVGRSGWLHIAVRQP
ncbi:hypothetical protein F9278_03295 [Streptomyces phaeolivaceus]|uniref:Uncharacterized protein n=1 Tax=Streptomyces phaeolivaceus TaxID=2653200 RepID=A0A5P8JXZ6_9ACTN|nr:hypothetical protein F9278_03295 [Streptomyces phaeolivaceus]